MEKKERYIIMFTIELWRSNINIIIDGYNLIGIHHGDLRSQRESLINDLISFRKKRGHDITLVFDGWKDGIGKETRNVTGGIKVVYTGIGEKADSVISKEIKRIKKKWVVVSSDREIETAAWKALCVPIDSGTFYHILEKCINYEADVKSGEYDHIQDEEEYDTPSGLKGDARRPSKKQREINRVLKKL